MLDTRHKSLWTDFLNSPCNSFMFYSANISLFLFCIFHSHAARQNSMCRYGNQAQWCVFIEILPRRLFRCMWKLPFLVSLPCHILYVTWQLLRVFLFHSIFRCVCFHKTIFRAWWVSENKINGLNSILPFVIKRKYYCLPLLWLYHRYPLIIIHAVY